MGCFRMDISPIQINVQDWKVPRDGLFCDNFESLDIVDSFGKHQHSCAKPESLQK